MQAVVKGNQDFTKGKITGKLISFVLPIMATGMLQIFYNASDMVVVGNFSANGSNAMGAVGSCTSLINLLIGLFIGISIGSGVVAARNIGAKRFDNVKSIIDTSVIFAFFCGIVVSLFGIIFSKNLLVLMGTPEEILNEADPYLKAYLVGVPANLVYLVLAAILRSSGDSKTPLIILAISGLFNVIVNVIMVTCFKMGAIGVGIATVGSQVLSLILIAIFMFRKTDYLKFSFKNFKLSTKVLANVIAIGVPAGLQTVLFSLSNVVIQSTVNSYGPETISGNAAAGNLEGFTYMSMNSFHQAVVTFVSQNMGAKKYKRIPKIAITGIILVSIVGVFLGVGIYLLGDTLLSIYEPESAIIRAWGLKRLSVVSPFHFLCGIVDVGTATLRGMGKSTTSMIIVLFGSVALRIVWIYTICAIIPNNIFYLYVSYPISWMLTSIALFFTSFIVYKKLLKKETSQIIEE